MVLRWGGAITLKTIKKIYYKVVSMGINKRDIYFRRGNLKENIVTRSMQYAVERHKKGLVDQNIFLVNGDNCLLCEGKVYNVQNCPILKVSEDKIINYAISLCYDHYEESNHLKNVAFLDWLSKKNNLGNFFKKEDIIYNNALTTKDQFLILKKWLQKREDIQVTEFEIEDNKLKATLDKDFKLIINFYSSKKYAYIIEHILTKKFLIRWDNYDNEKDKMEVLYDHVHPDGGNKGKKKGGIKSSYALGNPLIDIRMIIKEYLEKKNSFQPLP